jgi:hypothetical protein
MKNKNGINIFTIEIDENVLRNSAACCIQQFYRNYIKGKYLQVTILKKDPKSDQMSDHDYLEKKIEKEIEQNIKLMMGYNSEENSENNSDEYTEENSENNSDEHTEENSDEKSILNYLPPAIPSVEQNTVEQHAVEQHAVEQNAVEQNDMLEDNISKPPTFPVTKSTTFSVNTPSAIPTVFPKEVFDCNKKIDFNLLNRINKLKTEYNKPYF